MKHLHATIKYVTVILLGGVVFLFDAYELTDPTVSEAILLAISVAKSGYFIWFTLTNIRATTMREFYFHEFIPFVVLTVLLIVLSFGIDYFCLYHIQKDAFAGSFNPGQGATTFLAFLYFSVTTFTTAGLGEIIPQTSSARIFVMFELFVSFFFTILVIANIAQIRDSFRRQSKQGE